MEFPVGSLPLPFFRALLRVWFLGCRAQSSEVTTDRHRLPPDKLVLSDDTHDPEHYSLQGIMCTFCYSLHVRRPSTDSTNWHPHGPYAEK